MVLHYISICLIILAGVAIIVSLPVMWEDGTDGESSFIRVWFVTLMFINALAGAVSIIQSLMGMISS